MSIYKNENNIAVKYTNGGEGSGSGGHTIVNNSGTALTQRQFLKFTNVDLIDDSSNNTTIVSLGAAANKAVDTSILNNSTSINIPTSQAVASFVENKGYITSAPVTSVNGQTGDVNISTLTFHILRVGENLPSAGIVGDIYFKPNGNLSGTNLYDEWVDLDGEGNWENLGSISVDLSNYATLNGAEALTNKTINGYTPREAMGKSIDSSIVDNSTSTNLPTSAAVASFVENKGYLTSAPVTSVNNQTGEVTINEITTAERTKLAGIETGAQVNTVTSVNGQTGDVTISSGGSETWVDSYTLGAANWADSQYSLETDYPSTDYDILNVIPGPSTSSAQRTAWAKAKCGGYNTSNIIVAHGSVPTIDINISLCIREKS